MIVYVQAEVQHLPRMSAAYGFMANPAGSSAQLPQPVPDGVALHPRHTLLPASPMAAHATPMLLVSPSGLWPMVIAPGCRLRRLCYDR